MSPELGRLCNLCDETVWSSTIDAHYEAKHPGEEWDLATWPDGEAALIETDRTPS